LHPCAVAELIATAPDRREKQLPRTLKLTLAYDGFEFKGWQIQPDFPTIQGVLAEVIGRTTGEKVLPQGSGRTDAGVHALAQVATFSTASPIPTDNLKIVLNDRLPPSIRVLKVEHVPDGFHARHSAIGKSYRYRMYRGEVVPPFLSRYVTHYPYPLDEAAMIAAAREVVGEHDFTSFAAVDPDRSTRLDDMEEDIPIKHATNIRTILESQLHRDGEELIYTVRGNGFLHHMVRNLVGTFLLVGRGTLKPEDLAGILAARDRRAAGATAPAEGLYLVSVEY
jgi:tRNA pseudouridine38-40 synthase